MSSLIGWISEESEFDFFDGKKKKPTCLNKIIK
jgi:hypothetical protein